MVTATEEAAAAEPVEETEPVVEEKKKLKEGEIVIDFNEEVIDMFGEHVNITEEEREDTGDKYLTVGRVVVRSLGMQTGDKGEIFRLGKIAADIQTGIHERGKNYKKLPVKERPRTTMITSVAPGKDKGVYPATVTLFVLARLEGKTVEEMIDKETD